MGHDAIQDMTSTRDLQRYTNQLRRLPFVRSAKVREPTTARSGNQARWDLSIKTPTGELSYLVDVKATNISHPLANEIISKFGRNKSHPWMLFASYVPPGVAEEFTARGVQFVDEAGNCNIRMGDAYMAQIGGRRPTLRAPTKTANIRGLLVYFAVLASPELRSAPVRALETAIGVSKSVVSTTLKRMKRERLLVERKDGTRWFDNRVLLDRWIAAYPEIVRPRLLWGTYRTSDTDPAALEARVAKSLPSELRWAFGGGSAANQLTGHFHGNATTLHIIDPPQDLALRIRALSTAEEPTLIVFRATGPLLIAGATPRSAHPLLVYSELLALNADRAREAAGEIRDRFLRDLG
jgi:hypothetical protein